MSKQALDYYMTEWVAEWDEELAELVTVSDLVDIVEHKHIIMKELTDILNKLMEEAAEGERAPSDIVELLDTMKWLVEL